MLIRTTGRAALTLIVAMSALPALADGNGVMSDVEQGFEYTSGVFVVPNVTPTVPDPVPVVCEPGTPSCDVYTLELQFTDEFRDANPGAILDVELSWGGMPIDVGGVFTFPDFDMYLHDSAGNDLYGAGAATAANPEIISMPLDLLENGAYDFRVIPFFPMGESFTLKGTLAGLEEETKSGGLSAGGALTPFLLLPLLLLARVRRA